MNNNINNKFPKINLPKKPRKLRQTWLKDVGFHEAPHYLERMGLTELEDFLEVASERIDYVKFTTPQVLYSPNEWLNKKLNLYKKYNIIPFLDHTYFKFAYKNNCVDYAIKHGKSLGFESMEFMNIIKVKSMKSLALHTIQRQNVRWYYTRPFIKYPILKNYMVRPSFLLDHMICLLKK